MKCHMQHYYTQDPERGIGNWLIMAFDVKTLNASLLEVLAPGLQSGCGDCTA